MGDRSTTARRQDRRADLRSSTPLVRAEPLERRLALSAVTHGEPPPPPPLRVTEINYSPPAPSGAGQPAPAAYAYIEVKNVGDQALQLEGMRFTAGVSFTFPDYTLAPGAAGVVVAYTRWFAERYGSGIPVIGTYSDYLAPDGERIRLENADGRVIQDFSYSNTWEPSTDRGAGYSLNVVDPYAAPSAWNSPAGWRASKFVLGSPGMDEVATPADAVVVNELLTTGQGAAGDWLELKNNTPQAIDIGGWYLTDAAANLLRYHVPAGTVIQPNGYLVLSSESHFGGSLDFGATGGDVFLSASATPGVLSGFRAGYSFGAADPGVTFGRHVTSTGAADFVALSSPTQGAANAAPRVGPVVINEIMYNPMGTGVEYVELRNLTGQPVLLHDPANSSRRWRLRGVESSIFGFPYAFPPDATVPADGFALVVPIDPAAFRAQHDVPQSVPIFRYVAGDLDDAGEALVLAEPSPGGTVFRDRDYKVLDRVVYDDEAPWPKAADGTGASLAKANSSAYGNDPAHWSAEAPGGSPGRANFGQGARPTVTAASFVYQSSPHKLTYTFNRDVRASLDVEDLTVVPVPGSTPVVPTGVSYDVSTNTATFTFAGALPNGDYRATLSAAGVTDASNVPMAADHVQTFFALAGDVNRDRAVNGSDFALLAQNFGRTAMSYDRGDLNGDGSVNGTDFALLASNFGRSLPSPPPTTFTAGAAAVTAAAPVSAATPAPAPSRPPSRPPVNRRPAPRPAQPRAMPRPRRIAGGEDAARSPRLRGLTQPPQRPAGQDHERGRKS